MSLQPLGMASRASGACLGASTASFRCSVSFGVSVVLLTHPPRPLAHSLTHSLAHSMSPAGCLFASHLPTLAFLAFQDRLAHPHLAPQI